MKSIEQTAQQAWQKLSSQELSKVTNQPQKLIELGLRLAYQEREGLVRLAEDALAELRKIPAHRAPIETIAALAEELERK